MLLFLTIAGGVALILFGIRFLQKGLDRLFGPLLGRWMQAMARSTPRAFFTGVGTAMAAPSSTTVGILAVQLLEAGHLDSRRMLSIMLGANVGVTVLILLVALRLEQFAPVLLLVGVVLFQYTRRARSRGIGQVVLSLGFIFLAIGIISSAARGFSPEGDFARILEIAQAYPVWIVLIAVALAVAFQSSTAAIALVLSLSTAGAIDLQMAIPAVVGANVGIGVTVLLVGWRRPDTRRLGLGNLVAKVGTALLVLLALPLAVWLIGQIPLAEDKQIALSHLAFNLLMAAIFLPLVGPLDRILQRMVPDAAAAGEVFGPRYINQNGAFDSLALATGQSMRELLRVSEIVRSMLDDLWRALVERDEQLAQEIQERDDQVDLLDAELKRYLASLSAREEREEETAEIMRQLRYLAELETIGDVIDKNLAELVIKRIRQRLQFSEEGWADLNDFYQKVRENVLIAETAFTTRDRVLAQKLLRHKERLGDYERELRDRHFHRLRSGMTQSHESSAVHLDLLTHLKRINNCVTHVAYAVLGPDAG